MYVFNIYFMFKSLTFIPIPDYKMPQIHKASFQWKCITIIFGIPVLFKEHKFAAAEVRLTSPSKTIAENSPLELTCTYTGTTTVQAFDMSLQNLEGSVLPDCSIFVKQPDATLYNYSCPTSKQLKWTIKTVTRANDGDIWECRVYIPGGTETATYIMSVHVPVHSVAMTSPTGSVVTVPENTETVFVCTTSGGLPAATVRWYNDQNTSGTGDDVEITHYATVTSRKTDDDLVSVTSTLRYSPSKEDNEIKIYCTANNSANTLTSGTKPQLNVLYSPDGPPKIIGYSNGNTYKIIERSQGLMSCSIEGGNPLATLIWDCYNTGLPAETIGNTVIKNITWTATHNQDRSCTCHAAHEIAGKQSFSVKIQTLNQTSISSFYVEGNTGKEIVTANEHDDVRFTCVIDSNPAPSIKIMFENKILKDVLHTKTVSFVLTNAACDQSGLYTCEGRNVYGQPSYKTIRLSVTCSPRPLHKLQQNITSSTDVPVTLSVTVLAYPEPGPTGYTWHKEVGTRWRQLLSNADMQISSLGLQSNLTILNVSQSDYGQYRVTIENNIGTFEEFLFMTGNQEHTTTEPATGTDNDSSSASKTTMIVGVSLGLFSFAVVVYATVVTILWKRKTTSKETSPIEKSTTQTTYANLAYKSNVTERQGCVDIVETAAEQGNIEASDKQYTSLNPLTKDDKSTYDVIQTH